jgi:hypothetical protein
VRKLCLVLGGLVVGAHGQNCTGGIELVGKLRDGATSIAGIAGLLATVTAKQVMGTDEILIPLANGATSASSSAIGAFTLNLANPLSGRQHLRIYQVSSGAVSCIDTEVPGDLGRIRYYFTGGEMIAHDTGFKSGSTLFLVFNVDKNWKWAGRLVLDSASHAYTWAPGVGNRILWNTFFETRLTSVPETLAATPGSSLTTFLGSRKSAAMQAGNYFPVLINHWSAHGTQNSMFVAPLVTVGLLAPTDSATPGSTPLNPG